MDYAIQLFLPILGGLLLGYWLNQNWGVPSVWTVVLAMLGMVAGLIIMYRRIVRTAPPRKTFSPRTPPPEPPSTATDLSFLYQDFDDTTNYEHQAHDPSEPQSPSKKPKPGQPDNKRS